MVGLLVNRVVCTTLTVWSYIACLWLWRGHVCTL